MQKIKKEETKINWQEVLKIILKINALQPSQELGFI